MKKLFLCPAAFAVGLLLLVGLTVLSCLIPSEYLADNARASAEYILENEESFHDINRPAPFAYQRLDNYADMILFNLAYSIDSDRPFASLLQSRYLLDPYRKSAELVIARVEGEETNADYSRYWHGMLMFLRPLMCIMTYPMMRVLNAVVLVGLAVWLFVLFIRRGVWWMVPISLFAFLVTDWYTVPLCFEFYTLCALSLLLTCLVLILDRRFKPKGVGFVNEEIHLLIFFTFAGLSACFFDFLTTETLSLLLPLLAVLITRAAPDKSDPERKFGITPRRVILLIVCCAAVWGISYALTYVVKWSLAAAFSPDITFGDALGYAEVRASGAVEKAVFPLPIEALLRNLAMLPILAMPGTDTGIYTVCIIALVAALIYLVLIGRKPRELAVPALIALLSLVPYIRFTVLSNHSTLHHFFTYRAQAASIIAFAAFLVLAAEPKILAALSGKKAKSADNSKNPKRKGKHK